MASTGLGSKRNPRWRTPSIDGDGAISPLQGRTRVGKGLKSGVVREERGVVLWPADL
jgi:hypothetical protein